MTTATDQIAASFAEHRAAFDALTTMNAEIAAFAAVWWDALSKGNTVYFCGNGGSAGDSQHIAAELSGRFESERRGLRGMALTTDSSALTAIANDYGYAQVFARQVQALARPGDVLVAISTSGNSAAIVHAATAMTAAGGLTLGLTGAGGGQLAGVVDRCLKAPATRTARVQEMHILIGHCCCQLIDTWVQESR